jgi:DNA processing protein
VHYELTTLTLLQIRGIGPKFITNFWKSGPLVEKASDLFEHLRSSSNRRIHEEPTLKSLTEFWMRAESILEQCERDSITVLGKAKPLPRLIQKIPNAPLLLFLMGDNHVIEKPSVAIIGTREPTEYGKKSGRRIAKILAEEGWVITSGLAEGCDTEAHEGCLEGNGNTIAVIAHGFGKIYPQKNKELAGRIIDSGGCLVTEYPPGTPPTKSSFIERDRIQSGISCGIIVIETDVKGGTMHTVGYAEAQKRKIATLSHPAALLLGEKTRGNQQLIKDGRAIALVDRINLTDFVKSMMKLPESSDIVSFGEQTELGF